MSLVSHVIYLMLVHQEPSHSHALNEGKAEFYEENRIRCIAFKFEVISYKPLLDLLNVPPRFSRNVVSPYFTTIQDNMDDKSFKEELLFIPHDQYMKKMLTILMINFLIYHMMMIMSKMILMKTWYILD